MANVKITDLTAYTDPASTDVIPIVDLVNDQTKKVALADIFQNFPGGTAAAPSIAFDGDSNTGIYSPGADQIAITTAGTGRLFISDDGKVGIGVSDPSSYNVSADDLVIEDPNGFNTGISINITDNVGFSNIWFGDSDGEGRGAITYGHDASDYLHFNVGGSTALRIEATGTVNFVGAGSVGSTQAVSFNGSAPVDSLIVDSSGRVGIGVTPEQILHVKGGTPAITIERSSGIISGLIMKATGSSTDDFVLAAGSGESEFYTDQYEFKNAAGTTEYMIIDSSGRVGVGTSTPDALLTVNGVGAHGLGSAAAPSFAFAGDLNTGLYSPGADQVALATNGTGRLFVDSSGNVFINGTTAATADIALNANGSATFKAPSGSGVEVQTVGGNEGSKFPFVGKNTSGTTTFSVNGDGSGYFNGSLGIGTTSPAAELDIERATGTVELQLQSRDSSDTFISFGDNDDGDIGQIRYAHSNNSLTFKTNTSNAMTIDSSGRLLVGTSTSRIVEDLLGNGPQGLIQIEAANSDAIMSIISAGTSDAGRAGTLSLGRHRNSTVGGTPTVVQSGDTLGAICFAGGDGTDMRTKGASIACQVDGTPGANDMPGRLVFSTTADGDPSPTERMRIDNIGKTTIKTGQASNTRNRVIQIECSGQGRGALLSGNSDTDPATLGSGSDRRLKTNIREYTGGLEKIKQIPVKIYDEVNTDATDVIGWVADEVSQVFPDAVIGEPNAVDAEGNPEYQMLASLKFYPDLIQCVQTLVTKIETLEAKVAALEGV